MGWQDAPLLEADAAPVQGAQPAWASAPVVGSPASTVTQRAASGPLEAIQAGFQGSATGLVLRNRLPDVVLDPQHSKWYERALASAGQMVSDLPEMVGGGVAGAVAGGAAGSAVPVVGNAAGALVGTGAGAFALPAAIREAYMQALTKGDVTSSSDFLSRVGIVLKTAGKEGLIGGLTFGAGGVAARTAGKIIAPAIGESLSIPAATRIISGAETAGQYGTMVVAPAALEGKLPEPEDFLNAAILLGSAKAAGAVAGKLRSVYAQAGVPPEGVVRDSTVDPSIQEDLAKPGEEIPKAYDAAATESAVREIVPGEKAAQVAANPFAEVTQLKGEPAIRGQVNYNRLNDPELVGPSLARLAQVYESEIDAARRGTKTFEQTDQEASQFIQDVAAGRASVEDITGRVPGEASLSAKTRAAARFLEGAAVDLKTQTDAYLAKVEAGTASPEDTVQYLATAERSGMILSETLGARAELGRAMSVLRMSSQSADRGRAIQDILAQYPNDPVKIAQALKDADSPGGALDAAKRATDPTFAQKIGEIYKSILLSGPKTYMVKAIGDSVNIAMTTAERWVAATISKIPGVGSGEIGYDEAMGLTAGQIAGTRNALRVGAAAWNGEGPFEHTSAIGGTAGKVLQIPHRIMSAETEFFRTFDEGGQLRALAIRQASKEGFASGTDEHASRVADLEAQVQPLVHGDIPDGTPDLLKNMAAAVKLAGDRGTFTEQLGELGQAVQGVSRTAIGQFIIPFARVPANLLKFAVRYLPGVNLAITDVRSDLAAGGAARDLALAKTAIGGVLAATAFAAVKGGTLTGSGASFTPEEKSGKLASGEWQPYSIKMGSKWYSYNRFEPMARVLGVGADIAELNDRVEGDDKASLPALVALMFGHAVISETYLSTLDGIMKGLEDPKRNGKLVFDNFVGSWVPGFLAQTATAIDPNKRVVDDWIDTLKSRIPYLREQLLPKINPLTGQPEPNPKTITPVDVVSEASDKVLSEAGRIGVMVRGAPPNIQLPGSGIDRKAGQVATTPAQRDKFNVAAGTLAHQVLTPIVNEAGWDKLPDVVQKRIYEKVLTASHKLGAAAAFTPEERAAYIGQMQEKIGAELAATGDEEKP